MIVKGLNRKPRGLTLLLLVSVLLAIAFSATVRDSQAVATAPSLGTAANFAVLGGSTVTNTGATIVTGDLGVSPGSAIVGFDVPGGPGTVVGTQYAGGAVADLAQADSATAYGDLSSQACDVTYGPVADIGGETLTPAVYCFPSSAAITGLLTLDAQGDPDAVWVFKIESTLVTASASQVLIINGGNACNLFWRVGSSATLGTTTDFHGNILALAAITANTGATVNGRLLAQVEAVTMDSNLVTIPTDCEADPDPEPGNIVVEMQTNPDGSTTQFAFTSDYGPFTLQDGQNNNSGNLNAGPYTIAATLPPGATLTGIVCISADGSTFTVDLPNNEVEVELAAGDTVNCAFNITEQQPPLIACPAGAADFQRTVILAKGMGNDNKHRNMVKIVIPNWQTVDELYGQLVGEENGAARYVRFMYPNNTFEQVNIVTSPGYRQWTNFWYGADLDPAAHIRGKWFLMASGKKNHIPRGLILYPTYRTTEEYVNVFDPLAFDNSIENHVYQGWISAQQYRMEIPAPLEDVTIVVQVSLAGNDKDTRPVNLTVSAAGATSQTISPKAASHGDQVSVYTFSLNIQAGTSEIVLDLVSPSPNGDSVSFTGVTAHYACVPSS